MISISTSKKFIIVPGAFQNNYFTFFLFNLYMNKILIGFIILIILLCSASYIFVENFSGSSEDKMMNTLRVYTEDSEGPISEIDCNKFINEPEKFIKKYNGDDIRGVTNQVSNHDAVYNYGYNKCINTGKNMDDCSNINLYEDIGPTTNVYNIKNIARCVDKKKKCKINKRDSCFDYDYCSNKYNDDITECNKDKDCFYIDKKCRPTKYINCNTISDKDKCNENTYCKFYENKFLCDPENTESLSKSATKLALAATTQATQAT